MPDLSQVTDDNLRDIMEVAEYGGITYWATQATPDEFAAAPENKDYVIVEGSCDYFTGEREVLGIYHLSLEDMRTAFGRLLDLDQKYVNSEIHGCILQAWIEREGAMGVEVGHIDADTADAIVQVACFNELRYG